MPKRLHLRLITPDRILSDEDMVSITLPTPNGEITILPDHQPLTALLVPGVIRLKRENEIEDIASSGGFINVTETGEVSVLADTAERGHELDLSTIEEAKNRAQAVMQQAANKDDVSFALAAAAMERELARYKVATKYRQHRSQP